MKIRIIMFWASFFTWVFYALTCSAQFSSLSDCLVVNDIGIYTYKASRTNMGTGSGIVGMAGHFNKDHNDNVCTGSYSNINQLRGLSAETIEDKLISVKVQITQHTNSDSDKWLLHEVEDGYRDGEMERLGLTTKGARIRDNNGTKFISLRGSGYSWISNNIVVEISYSDLEGNKPEPLEIIQAYLQKFPSTIPSTLALDKAHSEQWIKDEMERRLWLCDKWFEQLQSGKIEQRTVLEETVRSMNIFLDYREKYYGVKAADDKNLLDGYLTQNDEANISAKLQEYKTWWNANKTGSLIGVLSVYAHQAYNHVSNVFKKLFIFLSSLWERFITMFR